MRRTRGTDDGSVPVELVEAARDDEPTDPRAERPAGRRRALWWVGVGVIAILGVVVVSVNVVDARREAARRAALAELPWVLPHMSGPLREAWRAPGGIVMAETPRLLVVLDYPDGSLRAVDRRSGAVTWQRAPHDDVCRAFVDPRLWSDDAAAAPPPEPDLLLCVPNSDAFVGAAAAVPASDFEVLDVSTGRVVASIPTEGAVIGSDVVGDDVVVASLLADGTVEIARIVGRTGEAVWTYRSEPARVPPDGQAWAYVDGDVALVDGGVTMAVSLDTGREVPVPDGAFDADMTHEETLSLPDGAQARWRYVSTTGRAVGGRVVEADGSTRFTFDGGPWGQGPTDGSAAGVFVVQQHDTTDDADYQGLLVGLDLATGDQLWSVPDVFSQRLLQIDGLAVAVGVTTSAIDVRTGRRLWERPVSSEIATVPLTDGDVVLLPQRDAGGDGLVAVDLRSGVESWWMPAPSGVDDVRVEDDGLVLLLTGSEIVAYR